MINEESVSEGHASVAWPPFEQKLAATIGSLEEDQFLILSVKHSNKYVQFAAQGSFGMRLETTSSSYLPILEHLNEQQISSLIDVGWYDPTGRPSKSTPGLDPDGSPNFFVEFSVPVSFKAVANLAVHTMTEILCVPHPGFLEYDAFDADGNEITLPGLGLKQTEPTPQDGSEGGLAKQLLKMLRNLTHIDDLDFDENGCLNFRAGNLPMFVAIADSPSYIRVGSPIHSVHVETANVLALLNHINASIPIVHFFLRDETVYGVVDIPAFPFVAEHIVHAIGQIHKAAEGISKMLLEKGAGNGDQGASSAWH